MSENVAREIVAEEWALILGVEPRAGQSNFFEEGGDSLQAVELVTRLEDRLGVAVAFEIVLLDGDFDALVDSIERA